MLQLVVPDVATSISCRDINLMNCNFQVMVPDVATSILCRHHFISLQLSTDVFYCRDINPLSRHHFTPLQVSLVAFGVATSVFCRDNSLSHSSSSFQTCHSFKALFLSQPPFLVATSTFVVTSRCCRDIIPLVSAQSSAAYLVIPVATCIKFPSIFLMLRPHNWTVQTPKLQH